MTNILLVVILSLLTLSAGQLDERKNSNPEITAGEFQKHINFLASDKLEGRFTGSKGSYQASEYIKSEFKSYGLQPLFGSGYFQEFPFVADLEITKNNYLAIQFKKSTNNLNLGESYTTAPFSDKQDYSGNLVFVGYGISASNLEYDDYEGIDVKDKTVLIMRYHPEYDNPHSEFEKYAAFRYKATIARDKGAKAVIFVNGHLPKDSEDKLMALRYDQAANVHSMGIVQVKRDIIDKLFRQENLDFAEYQKNISENKQPASFEFKDVKIKLKTEIKEIINTGRNIVGYLKGNAEEHKDEFIVIGAHFDHLGYGKTGSLYRGEETLIHNGADDNASGTAGILELAQEFADQKEMLKRNMVFIAFSGEELGLLGSAHFVKNTPMAADQMVAMLNMDMIGRMDENKLIVYGAGTSPKWKDILNELNHDNFKLTFHDEGYGPSDHSSFYGKEMPVLHFFTGTHPDYHRPSDDADKINSEGARQVLEYVFRIASTIDKTPGEIEYVNIPQRQQSRRGFRVYVGTIPDYSENLNGLKISGVSKDGPAEKAGLKGGDIIVKFGGKEITNIYDYTYALQDATPGDIVDVVITRNGERLTFKIELGAR